MAMVGEACGNSDGASYQEEGPQDPRLGFQLLPCPLPQLQVMLGDARILRTWKARANGGNYMQTSSG